MEEKNKQMIIKDDKNKTINYMSLLSVICTIAVIITHIKGGDIESYISILYVAFVRKDLNISTLSGTRFFNAISKSIYMFPYWFLPALF